MKTERKQIHFLSDVLVAVALLDLKVPNADKHGYFGPFDKNRARPKTRQKGEFFSMIHVVSHRI